MRSVSAQKGRIKQKRPFPKQKRSKFVSLRGRSAAVAILKPKVWHPTAKHGAPSRRISNISEIKVVGFIAKPTIFVSLRGRSAAVAILKPKVRHPVAKHGSTKQQNPQILNRPAGAPHRRFSGSAISRGRTPAFPVLQHLSHDQRSYFTAKPYSLARRATFTAQPCRRARALCPRLSP